MALVLGVLSGALFSAACYEAWRGNSWRTLFCVAWFAFLVALLEELT